MITSGVINWPGSGQWGTFLFNSIKIFSNDGNGNQSPLDLIILPRTSSARKTPFTSNQSIELSSIRPWRTNMKDTNNKHSRANYPCEKRCSSTWKWRQISFHILIGICPSICHYQCLRMSRIRLFPRTWRFIAPLTCRRETAAAAADEQLQSTRTAPRTVNRIVGFCGICNAMPANAQ